MDLRKIFEQLNEMPRSSWSEGEGDNNYEELDEERSIRPQLKLPHISKVWLIIGGFLLLFVVVLPGLAHFLTDLYWFESHGFEAVFWRRLFVRWELFVLALVPAFLTYWFNWRFSFKHGFENISPYTPGLSIPRINKLIIGISVAFAIVNALSAMDEWAAFLQCTHSTLFGKADPLFGIDVGFYVFTLPFVAFLQSWLQGIIALALIGSVCIYFFTRSVYLSERSVGVTAKAGLHMTLLGAALLMLWGAGYWLDRYKLLYSPTGVVFGAGYTDVNVLLPALSILTVAAVVASVLLLLNFFKPMWKLSAVIIGVLLVFGFTARTFVPGIIQQYRVKPNEYEMEKPYLGYHLDYTRKAFGLDKVKTFSITPAAEVTAEDVEKDSETVYNIRLWDYKPLLGTYRQLQAIRTYYDFNDVYIDRYMINGENRQVILSVRELDLSHLQNPTWVNMHLEFTHGYGVVMNPVNEIAPGGLPNFFMKDLPSRSIVDIPLTRPEIYYGSKKYSYVLVGTQVREFDYPMGASNVRSTYAGDGGVAINSFWRRLLFAIRFRDTEILFTGSLKERSRVLFHRNVKKALYEAAPFLIYDDDTYPVIYDGRILWVQDCFTCTRRYPYSNPVIVSDPLLRHFNGVNYIRNSVKATVDAYNGRMNFYVVDAKDPVVQTWRKIFPSLFRDGSELPKELWEHMRYPQDFFEVQSDVYRTYHMTDTNTYYNREDVWEVTPGGRDRRIEPNYVTMKLWGGNKPEFAVIVPYMPLGRDNLIGWMAGRCDPENYGELLVYQFPKQELIYGPAQIEALIDQNPEISAQLSLWSQRGSDVIRGDLLVIPVGKSLLYVQPLYLKAERGELPELKRVIVSTGGRVAWDDSFDGALAKLFSARARVGKTKSARGGGGALSVQTIEGDIISLSKRASQLYSDAVNAQRNGEWAKYGEKLEELGQVISQMESINKK